MSSRLQRFQSLRVKGLFFKEAQELSKNEFEDVPYFAEYIKDRQKILREWKKSGSTNRKAYLNSVRKWYRDHNWMKGAEIDVWKAWREYESKWKEKNPDYIKPGYKRHKDLMITERKQSQGCFGKRRPGAFRTPPLLFDLTGFSLILFFPFRWA